MFGIVVQHRHGKPYFYCHKNEVLKFATIEEAELECENRRKFHTRDGFPAFTPKKISQRFCRQWRATKNQDYVE